MDKPDYQTQCIMASNLAQIVYQNLEKLTDGANLTVDNIGDKYSDEFLQSLQLATSIYLLTFDELNLAPAAD